MRLALLSSFACTASVAAQTPTAQLIGRVLENGRSDGISGAAIKLSNGATTVSDKRGLFTFANVPEGRVLLSVEMIG